MTIRLAITYSPPPLGELTVLFSPFDLISLFNFEEEALTFSFFMLQDWLRMSRLHPPRRSRKWYKPEGATALVAEITPAGATTDAGEASPLPEEEATPKVGEEPTLPVEGVTIEARETPIPQDLPKDSASLDLPDGKEVLIF